MDDLTDTLGVLVRVIADLELEALDPGLAAPGHELGHGLRRTEGNRLVQREVLVQHATQKDRDRQARPFAEQVPAGDVDGALGIPGTKEDGIETTPDRERARRILSDEGRRQGPKSGPDTLRVGR